MTSYIIKNGSIVVTTATGGSASLKNSGQLAGYKGDPASPDSILLSNYGLHIEVRIDRSHFIGVTDPAGVADILVGAAISTILDMEDCVAAVDADDKVQVYRSSTSLAKSARERVSRSTL